MGAEYPYPSIVVNNVNSGLAINRGLRARGAHFLEQQADTDTCARALVGSRQIITPTRSAEAFIMRGQR